MERFLRRRDVVAITGLSRSQVDRLTKAGQFPSRVTLGPNSSAWLASEVQAWIAERVAASRAKAPQAA
ncbi:MAG: helix-turn-helix transcriptional regulator [Dongiaceae bacterium]